MRTLDAAVLVVAAALAGCESHLGGSLVYMEPYKFETFDCAELKKRAAGAAARLHDQNKLMDKASESAAGSVIGNVVYGPERSKAVWEQRLYEQQAARKNCDPPAPLTLSPPEQAPQ
jgi:hypothetical protein